MKTNSDYWRDMYRQQKRNWWWRAKEEVVAYLLKRYCRTSPQEYLLDVGSGPGFVINLFDRIGRGVGVEVSDEALGYCRQNGLSRLLKASASGLPFKGACFSVVSLIDSLEHVADETEAVRECRRVLKPSGALIIIVPAFPALWTKRDVLFGHYRRYSRRRLARLLQENGFEIKKLTYTNSFLVPALFALATMEKVRRVPVEVRNEGVVGVPGVINSALYCLLRMEFFLARTVGLPFGSSIVCCAVKKI